MSDTVPMRPDPEQEIDKALSGSGAGSKKIVPVAKGRIKSSPAEALLRTVFAESVQSVAQYALYELIIPAVKDTIQSVVVGSIERALYGESAPRPHRAYSSGFYGSAYQTRPTGWTNRTAYNSASQQRVMHSDEPERPPQYSDLIVPTRDEANSLLQCLLESAEKYGSATVGDLFGLAGMSTTYVDESWIWSPDDVARASVQMRRGGYGINIPPPSFRDR